MDERLIRERLRAAVGESDYPTGLTSQVAAHIRHPAPSEPRHGWVLTFVAVLLAVAIVATLIVGTRRLYGPTPVHMPPFQIRTPGTAVCLKTCNAGSPVFVSPDIGWVSESISPSNCVASCPVTSVLFRTDDGGFHWQPRLTWSHQDWAQQIISSGDGEQVLVVPLDLQGDSIGPLYSSDDGGSTWTQHSLPTMVGTTNETVCKGASPGPIPCSTSNLTPLIYFRNPKEGWLLSQEPTYDVADLFHTVDGGGHWSQVTRIDIKAQFDLDLSTGVTNANGAVDHSLYGELVFQGGSAWFIPNSRASLNGSFVPATGGPVNPPNVFRSVDGGLSWQHQSIKLPAGTPPDAATAASLKFFDDRNGVLEFTAYQSRLDQASYYVYATSDGGDSWTDPARVPNPSNALALDYVDATHWVGWPAQGGWMRTSDAGVNWVVTAPGPGSGLPGYMAQARFLEFLDPLHGWAYIGGQAALYASTDGGTSWHPLSLPELE